MKDFSALKKLLGLQKIAVSPPGWAGTVEAMKERHPEITNPWALAWWQYKHGHKSHIPESAEHKAKKAAEKKASYSALTRLKEIAEKYKR